MKKINIEYIKKIVPKLKSPTFFIFLIIVLQALVKWIPEFKNVGQIAVIVIYIYAITMTIFNTEEVDYLDRIVKFTFMIIFNSPLLVYSIVLFFKTFPNSMIKVGDANTWIAFAGSMLSGSLVMFAVVFTLQYEKKLKDQEFNLMSIPLIEFELSKPDEYEYKRSEIIKLYIKNIGNNHIRNLKITEMKSDIRYQSKESDYDNGSLGELEIEHMVNPKDGVSVLPNNKCHEVCIRFNDPRGLLITEDVSYLLLMTEIKYWNILLRKEFKFRSTVKLKVLRKNDEMYLKYLSSTSMYDPESYTLSEDLL